MASNHTKTVEAIMSGVDQGMCDQGMVLLCDLGLGWCGMQGLRRPKVAKSNPDQPGLIGGHLPPVGTKWQPGQLAAPARRDSR